MKRTLSSLLALIFCLLLLTALFGCKKTALEPKIADNNQTAVPPVEGQATAPTEHSAYTTEGLTAAIRVGFAGASTMLLRDSTLFPSGDGLTVSLAKNEKEAAQMFFSCTEKAITEKSIKVSDLEGENGTLPASSVTVYRQHYINVSLTWTNYPQGYYPDALVPVSEKNSPFTIEKNTNQGYWLTVSTDKDTPAGVYKGTVSVEFDCGSFLIPISVTVWDITLPDENSFDTSFGVTYDRIISYYGFSEKSDEEIDALCEAFYEQLLDYRINPYYLPIATAKSKEEWCERAKKYAEDPRVRTFVLPWYDDEFLAQLDADILAKGYIYAIDEPKPETYGTVLDMAQKTKKAASESRFLITKAPILALAEVTAIWCPLINYYDREQADTYRQQYGAKVWWYNCLEPVAPYTTYMLEDGPLAKRIMAWMQKAEGVDGVLYWSVHNWTTLSDPNTLRDVWNNPYCSEGFPGDGFLFYPGKEGDGIVNSDIILPTIRIEAIRDGFEDVAYLDMLEAKLAAIISERGLTDVNAEEATASLCHRLYSDLSEYNSDPEALLSVRAEVAEMLLSEEKCKELLSGYKNDSGYSISVPEIKDEIELIELCDELCEDSIKSAANIAGLSIDEINGFKALKTEIDTSGNGAASFSIDTGMFLNKSDMSGYDYISISAYVPESNTCILPQIDFMFTVDDTIRHRLVTCLTPGAEKTVLLPTGDAARKSNITELSVNLPVMYMDNADSEGIQTVYFYDIKLIKAEEATEAVNPDYTVTSGQGEALSVFYGGTEYNDLIFALEAEGAGKTGSEEAELVGEYDFSKLKGLSKTENRSEGGVMDCTVPEQLTSAPTLKAPVFNGDFMSGDYILKLSLTALPDPGAFTVRANLGGFSRPFCSLKETGEHYIPLSFGVCDVYNWIHPINNTDGADASFDFELYGKGTFTVSSAQLLKLPHGYSGLSATATAADYVKGSNAIDRVYTDSADIYAVAGKIYGNAAYSTEFNALFTEYNNEKLTLLFNSKVCCRFYASYEALLSDTPLEDAEGAQYWAVKLFPGYMAKEEKFTLIFGKSPEELLLITH